MTRPETNMNDRNKFDISGLMTVHSIFVVETAAHPLVLGQPFIIKIKFTQSYRGSLVYGTINSLDRTIYDVFRTLDIEKVAHRSRESLFPSLN